MSTSTSFKTVLITGANGFIGKNLHLNLAERKDLKVIYFTRDHSIDQLFDLISSADIVFHLAGVNRPEDQQEFVTGNAGLTQALCDAVVHVAVTSGKRVQVVYASSIQVERDNLYGQSKREAENSLFELQRSHGVSVYVFRLPNVFGKWCKPNYNSVVATFCHNISRDLPIQINDPDAPLRMVYVDDVISSFLQLINGVEVVIDLDGFASITPQYTTTVGELASLINSFRVSRVTLMTERVGAGLIRALYATYMSYLPAESFSYHVPKHEDQRGVFVEMLKTPDCGQFSYFTAHPGITRGGHYHHTKTEKFLVIKGTARFKFRHMQSGETYELVTRGDKPEIVETVPGWTHDITNDGNDEMLVILWANEVFDRELPDTYASKV